MRNFKLFILGLLVSVSAVAMNPTNPTSVETKLQTQVDKYLGEHNLVIEENIEARLTFIVTDHDEIVVLRVVSKDESAEDFIKARLNYKTVKKTDGVKNKTYTMKVKIKPSES
ncbi:hypothetical protein N9L20_04730 [Flavobacteriaceae bacterium]|nr:hypothetical protein [Flavobacteriaceae bacterium]